MKATKRILVIDDDREIIQSVKNLLLQVGYEVIIARNGKEGLVMAKQHKPALVLCDLVMPEMDGYQVLAELQNDEQLAMIPVIFLSGLSEPRQVRHGMILGADDYLTKPIAAEDLLKTVQARLQRSETALIRREKYLERAIEIFTGELTHIFRDHIVINRQTDVITIKIREAWMKAKSKVTNVDGSSSLHPPAQSSPLLLKTDKEKILITLSEIRCIRSYAEYSKVFWDKNQHRIIRKSLKKWLTELPKRQYIRVHRNSIVNLAYLERIEILQKRHLLIYIKDIVEPVQASVRQIPSIHKKLNEFVNPYS